MIRAKLIVIGLACLASSVGMYAAYLTFSREIREYVFLDPKCLSGWINAAVDNLFELSVLSSLFLVFASVSRWLLIPWLIVYAVDILVMVALTIASLLVPLNNPQFPGRFSAYVNNIRARKDEFLFAPQIGLTAGSCLCPSSVS